MNWETGCGDDMIYFEEKRAKVVHNGVVCDECDKEVVGIRYKCAVCDDYDLCEECERKGKHSQHSMIRYATPNMPVGDSMLTICLFSVHVFWVIFI
ncbi:unnamed protein product [Anisakis simplex]|uniref:Sequestosome-1 (inferred by orthology to a human protein) n=1 Tax=Anisakis simplex TaxID=6269 RepID=A0A0M3JHG4_ANISI|nr:unnamed protein product [Anisakis simplex]